MLVALNPTTWQSDVVGTKPGGAVLHEAAFPVEWRDAARRLDVLRGAICAARQRAFADKGDLRKYLMNMIYVGALAHLLEIPAETIEEGLRPSFAASRRPSN